MNICCDNNGEKENWLIRTTGQKDYGYCTQAGLSNVPSPFGPRRSTCTLLGNTVQKSQPTRQAATLPPSELAWEQPLRQASKRVEASILQNLSTSVILPPDTPAQALLQKYAFP